MVRVLWPSHQAGLPKNFNFLYSTFSNFFSHSSTKNVSGCENACMAVAVRYLNLF